MAVLAGQSNLNTTTMYVRPSVQDLEMAVGRLAWELNSGGFAISKTIKDFGLLVLTRGPIYWEAIRLDIKLIGFAAVAGLSDAVAEIMTGQPTEDEKVTLMAQVEGADRVDVKRLYEGAWAAFRRDPGNAVPLFLSVSLGDIRALPAEEKGLAINDLLSLLGAAHKRGHVTEEEAAEVADQIEELLAAVGD